ncbi:phosphopantetheinyltransferase component of enterobactin synthase multienzyme complex [Thalassovita gelatinovora]|uniref:Enterobactin synthase component D n=1 Tax=Thalassovita gelatinovora TaxID=53501 RepID=A0A0P1F9Y5_THAGE|nr:4'-phosphopantetheinyl transferase superfamily protein [Thalassovita gelatinovora]QIZ81260.1 4'-phosphopantetheinyl transferase superfamily protein [Thalassovita gelatinovora]CUH64612.1 phosphopantetheinyltransferase component of enterobactin synthase multienzyme complex [Thalassovita gelatinovora]SEP94935.1 4'-phosphopantetheinyl transferase EntD (siderophore biosynthesis) [Thalassovita gelatinovora]
MNSDLIRQNLVQVFGSKIGIGQADPKSQDHRLMPAEQAAVANAVPKRVGEFAAGRAAARAALCELGLPNVAIPTAPDRSPIWPEGFSGSISHTDTACLAVVTKAQTYRAIGLDIEPYEPLPTEIWDIVLTDAEFDMVKLLPKNLAGIRAKKIFCIKEAAYKAQYPISKILFDFHTLHVRLQENNFVAEFRRTVPPFQIGDTVQGGVFKQDGHIISAAFVPNP